MYSVFAAVVLTVVTFIGFRIFNNDPIVIYLTTFVLWLVIAELSGGTA